MYCLTCGEQHIGRLEVAVDHAGLVRGGHGAGQHFHQPGGVARWQGGAGQAAVQRLALDEFQGQVRLAVVLADLVDLHDAGMPQPRQRLRLGAEAGPLPVPGRLAGANHLQGHQPLQRCLASLVDDTHAAPADLFHHLVARQLHRRRRPPARGRLVGGGPFLPGSCHHFLTAEAGGWFPRVQGQLFTTFRTA